MFEYKNEGPAAVINEDRRQLSGDEAAKYTFENVRDGWVPNNQEPERLIHRSTRRFSIAVVRIRTAAQGMDGAFFKNSPGSAVDKINIPFNIAIIVVLFPGIGQQGNEHF